MRVVIQRVSEAKVEIEGEIYGAIRKGLIVLCAFENSDTQEDLMWMAKKIAGLRIFNDENGVMNVSVNDINGELLIVSQFTLYASTKKGNRPSYIRSAKPDIAIPLYEEFILQMQKFVPTKIQTGKFGTDMKVSLINDGPVTIIIDSKNKE
ncbi:MAG TPA: D-tyrosyl-tRNA(Tyr) deacylase [Flavobacteriales bacterium]|nr:D-tyrosyl-tRNA(Tyr) deacylase [Flavobacteriales bacterium]|tara:strand:- start:7182 stop:7634 length:453 start_codon:yes stop_codon:yes gene_type:complete